MSSARFNCAAPLVAALLGCSAGMVVHGLMHRLSPLYEDAAPAECAVLAGSMFALAMGVLVPQRFALWVYANSWHRLALKGANTGAVSLQLRVEGGDRPLYWLVLSIVALVAGVLTGMTPALVRVVSSGYAWLIAHFLWSPSPLAIVWALTALVAVIAPLGAIGLALACVHRLSTAEAGWDVASTGWALIGAACGASVASWLAGDTTHPDLALYAAALPALVSSVAAVLLGPGASCPSSSRPVDITATLPQEPDRWPALLRAAIVLVGVIGVFCVAIVWLAARSPEPDDRSVVAMALAALGLGMLPASVAVAAGVRSIGGFGIACAAGGVALIFAALAIGRTTLTAAPSMGAAPLGVVLIALGVVGFAAAYGHRALFCRVASRAPVAATILARTVVLGALAAWIGAPLAMGTIGAHAAVAISSMVLITLGGLLVVLEPQHNPRTQRVRLAVIFASLIGATLLLPT